jgi:hypothetical protein
MAVENASDAPLTFPVAGVSVVVKELVKSEGQIDHCSSI